jgi:DNA-binding transcriptional LysR family regulator
MDLIDLELVVHVAEAGSITHGAARTHLTLPSASARIRALERTVGATLFDRGRRGVTPTPAGALLLRHARTVRLAVATMRTELAEFAEGYGATVRVLANTAATASLLTPAVTSFLAAHPKARVDLEERPSHRIVAAIAERRADLGIVADTVALGALDTHTLRADPLVAVLPAHDPLAARASVAYSEILTRDFVGLNHPSALQEHLEGHALPLGHRPTYRVRLPGIDAVCQAVAAGIGVAILPRHTIQPWLAGGTIAAIDLDDPWAHRNLTLCHTAEAELSPTARALRDHLTATHSRI